MKREKTLDAASDAASRPRSLIWDVVRGALLGLIAALAYTFAVAPAKDKAVNNARRASCQSNLKQIGLAYKQYITDYDERYPLRWTDGDGSRRFDSPKDSGWVQALQPYCKNVEIFQCPSEPNAANLAGGPQPGYTDYFTNGRLAGGTESAIEDGAQTVLLGDHPSSSADAGISSAAAVDTVAGVRHLNGANYGFADGHVKWLKPAQLSDKPVQPRPPNSSASINFYTFQFK